MLTDNLLRLGFAFLTLTAAGCSKASPAGRAQFVKEFNASSASCVLNAQDATGEHAKLVCATQPIAEVRKKVEALGVCAGLLGAGFEKLTGSRLRSRRPPPARTGGPIELRACKRAGTPPAQAPRVMDRLADLPSPREEDMILR